MDLSFFGRRRKRPNNCIRVLGSAKIDSPESLIKAMTFNMAFIKDGINIGIFVIFRNPV